MAEVLSCSTQRMATRGKHREEATARNRGSHEPGTRANRRPGFHGIGALSGDAFVEVSHVMPQERTTPKLSEALTQRCRSLEFRCRPE